MFLLYMYMYERRLNEIFLLFDKIQMELYIFPEIIVIILSLIFQVSYSMVHQAQERHCWLKLLQQSVP